MLSEAWNKQTDKVLVGNEGIRGLVRWREAILEYYEDDPDVEVVERKNFRQGR